MKINSSILKLIALVLSAAAILCVLMANLEAIMDTVDSLCGKAKGKFCKKGCGWIDVDDEYDNWDEDEYEDWDD